MFLAGNLQKFGCLALISVTDHHCLLDQFLFHFSRGLGQRNHWKVFRSYGFLRQVKIVRRQDGTRRFGHGTGDSVFSSRTFPGQE